MKKVGILYDNISGNVGDQAIGISVREMLAEMGVDYEELVPGRFNPGDYRTIIIGGGYLLQPSPNFFYDKFRVPGKHILNCCGIVGSPDDLQYLNDYLYVTVRSNGDKQKLSCLSREVTVVPCTAMLLKDLPRFDLKIQKPSIGVHLWEGVVDEEAFVEYLSKQPFHIYFLPITHYNRDFTYLERLSQKVKNSTLLPILKPEEIYTVIGNFEYFICTSLHGAIFAYVHNVPFVLYDSQDKQRFFMEDRKLDSYLFRSFDELKARFEELQNSKPDYSTALANDFKVLQEHKLKIKDIVLKQVITVDAEPVITRRKSQTKNQQAILQERNFQIHYLQNQVETLAAQAKRQAAQISSLEASLQEKVSRIANLEANLQEKVAQIHQIQQSIPMQLVNRYQKIIERLLRRGTRRRHYYELVLSGIRVILNEGWRSFWYKFRQWLGRRKSQWKSGAQPSGPYEKWIAQNEPNTHELRQQKKKAASFRYRPKLSIITPVWNPEAKWLKASIESVIGQTYDVWELCLVGDSSTDQSVKSILDAYSKKDSRFKVKFLPVEESISTNLKGVLSLTGGEYVGILDQEHELAPFALYQMVKLLNKEPETDFIYSDEDKISQDGRHRFDPKFKPAWAPDTLRSSNYIGRFFIVQRKVADLIAGNIQITSFDDSDAYDLVLQVTEKAKKIFHIPKILCHERETFAAPCAFDIETEVEYRNKVLHSARLTNAHGGDNRFKFSLIILNKNKPEYIIPLLEQLRKGNTGDYYEVIIGDTGTEDEKVLEYYGKFSSKIKIIRKLEYHFGGNYNFLIANYARGEVVGIMNNDIILPKTLFLNEIEDIFVNNKDVSVVGAKLLYPDGRLQHGGIFFMENSGVNTGLPYHRLHGGDPNRLPTVKFERVPAVTGSFMFCKRSEFIAANGFDESYKEEAQDVDLCLKLRRMRKDIVFANIAGIIHVENGTREKGSENWDDRRYFLWKWRAFLEATILGTKLNREFRG